MIVVILKIVPRYFKFKFLKYVGLQWWPLFLRMSFVWR